jgi:TRAP-type C4-dicarboxylate transport system permease small subunit
MVSDTRRNLLIVIGDSIAWACSWCATVALAVIVVVNGSNVVGRYIFGASIAWAEELMLYLMILVVFAGCVTVSWRGVHIQIDALIARFPPQLRAIVGIFIAVMTAGLMITVAYFGFNTVSLLFAFDQRSDALELPMWIPQSVVAGGLALSSLVIFLRLIAGGSASRSAGGHQ